MNSQGWKTVVVQNHSSLSFKDGCLVIENDKKSEVPVAQLKVLIIESLQVSLTSYLLNELNKNGVKVMFCDEKHLPATELVPYHDNYRQTENIVSQTQWDKSFLNRMWKHIIEQKISQQIALLQFENLDVPEELFDYLRNVEEGDSTNREGQAARLYFRNLFGSDFTRYSQSDTNACLNYGYSLILANISRKIVSMGYITNIGVHHIGVDNPYNLVCDLMEPFRPYIDRIVYENQGMDISSMKKILIESLYKEVEYNHKKTQFHMMLDTYVEDAIRQLKNEVIVNIQLDYF